MLHNHVMAGDKILLCQVLQQLFYTVPILDSFAIESLLEIRNNRVKAIILVLTLNDTINRSKGVFLWGDLD